MVTKTTKIFLLLAWSVHLVRPAPTLSQTRTTMTMNFLWFGRWRVQANYDEPSLRNHNPPPRMHKVQTCRSIYPQPHERVFFAASEISRFADVRVVYRTIRESLQ